MKKEFKNIRYSVKFYPDGKITCYELKNSITSSREVEKEITKNDECFSYIHDDLFSLCDKNYYEEIFKNDKSEFLDEKNDLENGIYDKKIISRAINRTKNTVYDIVYSNDWKYFVTLTFSPEKVDSRYDYNELSKKLRKFFNNYKNRYDLNFKYLVIPEKHQDGAFHFHGFIHSDRDEHFIDSQKKYHNDIIYNWVKYPFGFTNLTCIKSKEKCCSYILKYITKDLFNDNDFCRRKFSCSSNCLRPVKQTYENFDLTDFDFRFENDFVKIFEYHVKSDT